jgi:hypothetical protein
MRGFFSISTVAMLLVSLMSPMAWATCCRQGATGKAASCHEGAMPADHSMMHHEHHHHNAAAPVTTQFWSATDDPAKCPMDCCTNGRPQSGAAVTAAVVLPLPAIVGQELRFVSVTFSSPGFSSHTDRGPPSQ